MFDGLSRIFTKIPNFEVFSSFFPYSTCLYYFWEVISCLLIVNLTKVCIILWLASREQTYSCPRWISSVNANFYALDNKYWRVGLGFTITFSFNVKSTGCLYLTTIRLVFVADTPSSDFKSLVYYFSAYWCRIFPCCSFEMKSSICLFLDATTLHSMSSLRIPGVAAFSSAASWSLEMEEPRHFCVFSGGLCLAWTIRESAKVMFLESCNG